MDEKWTRQEVAIVIQARKLLKAKGLSKDADVKAICEAADISRKTGYQWAGRVEQKDHRLEDLQEELAHVKAQHEDLKRHFDDLRFENEGRKLAWEIHGVDELIRSKKNIIKSRRKQKR